MKKFINDISNITGFLLAVVIYIGALIGMFYLLYKFYDNEAQKCIENGGTVVTNSGGLFDKCIYGGKNG